MLFKYIQTALLLAVMSMPIWSRAQRVAPAAYNGGTKVNYIRTWDATAPVSNPNALFSGTLQQVKQATQYLDGLGRPVQTVVRKGSMVTGDSARDMVQPVEYDEYGREVYKYLPFAANSTGSNTSISDGLFKFNPFQQDSTFNKAMFPDEGYYYSKTLLEASPLSRVLEAYTPGNSWVGSAGESSEANRRGIKSKFCINTSIDSIRIWRVADLTNAFGMYSTDSSYPAGRLIKNITLDEHNKQVIEFKSKDGKVILKKVQLTGAADTGIGKGYHGWLCTYYIYDDLGQLRAVIQPEGVKTLAAGSWSITPTILAEQCFRYEYDERGRMSMKKVPGAGAVFMVYDARDRLVLTQDSMMRAGGKWMYTLYDSLNRPKETGLWTNSNTRTYHAGEAASSTAYPNLGGQTIEELTRTFYDNYNWRSGEGNPLSATRSTSYDSYLLTPSASWPYPQDATTQTAQLIGMVTGTKVRILGTSNFLYTVSFYNNEGQVIQVQATNITGATDIVTTQYSWVGQPLITVAKHEKANPNSQTSIVVTKLSYDDLGRLLKTEKKISNTKVNGGTMPGSWTTLSEHEYNALGQLKKKKLAPAYASGAGLEMLNYDYNIRGWMLGTNRDYAKYSGNTDHWFGFDLGYDKTTVQASGQSSLGSYVSQQFNGNIAGTVWKSKGDNEIRKYDFSYDAVNRFLSGDFNQYTSGSFNKNANVDFSVSGMTYDDNGNIMSMKQRGLKLASSITIDSLSYNYIAGSNRLLNVIDGQNVADTKLGDFRTSTLHPNSASKNGSTADYSYDGNGNMVKDLNKDIVTYAGANGIEYNYLNLPKKITVRAAGADKGTIEYTYDATGNKLKKVTTEGALVTTTLYMLGNYINDTLQFIATEEGRSRFKKEADTLLYDYMLKDHLGNVRMLLTEEQQTDDYPAASLETALLPDEKDYYGGLDTGRVNKSTASGYPNDTYTDPNDFIQKLNGNGAKIGANMLLKVMAGDKFNLRVNSWWKSNNTPNSPTNPLTDILNALNAGIPGLSGGKATAGQLSSNNTLSPGATDFLSSQSGYISSKPKAFVNWILFDEQFNYVSAGSGFEQVAVSDSLKTHIRTNQAIPKNGYLYIYVSNETSNIDVFFDNLQVTHIRGSLLEETYYYPFGLTMFGISSTALTFGKPKNIEETFQGQRFDQDLGLNWIQFKWRNHDPQIGRFIEIDPLSEKYEYNSTYAFSENKVTTHVELEGLEAVAAAAKNSTSSSTKTSWDPFSFTNWYGTAAVKNDLVRREYIKTAATLPDKTSRVDLKEQIRAKTPEPFKAIIEETRPIEGERAKVKDPAFKGNVTKTNAEANEVVKNTGVLGKVFIVGGLLNSGANIATADDPAKQVVVETGAWVGAIQGGSTGATLGSAFGPVGAVLGGLGGSILGGIGGSKLGQWMSENVVPGPGADAGFIINGVLIRNIELGKR